MEINEKNEKISLRRENRILAVQWIYLCEATRTKANPEILVPLCNIFEKDPESFKFAQEIVSLLQKNLAEIDTLIDRFATNWNFSRISLVDLCIIRLSICELSYRTDIPLIMTIKEAINLGKMF
jgi:N utilization substance protein B